MRKFSTNWVGLYTFIRREIERIVRVATQTLITPWISALLYIFIFGYVVGRKIDLIVGVSYIDFVLPGIIMMNVISSAFAHSSSSVYFKRFIRDIEEILIAPLSYIEMMIGFVTGAVVRGVIIACGIYVIALIFTSATIDNLWLFIFYTTSVSIIFALLGILVGLWAKGFEQLNVLNTFVIMPLSFLGGVFYSVTMLPPKLRILAFWNPFFYFTDGIRYSMIGISEANYIVGLIFIFSSIIILGSLVWVLFSVGWRLRE